MTSRALSVQVHPNKDALVIRAIGDLDLASASAFETKVREALASGVLAMLLDLSQVEFIDSTGLRALLAAEQLARTNQCRFGIWRKVSPAVERAIDVAGLADRLPLAE